MGPASGKNENIQWLKWTGAAVLFVEALIVSYLSLNSRSTRCELLLLLLRLPKYSTLARHAAMTVAGRHGHFLADCAASLVFGLCVSTTIILWYKPMGVPG